MTDKYTPEEKRAALIIGAIPDKHINMYMLAILWQKYSTSSSAIIKHATVDDSEPWVGIAVEIRSSIDLLERLPENLRTDSESLVSAITGLRDTVVRALRLGLSDAPPDVEEFLAVCLEIDKAFILLADMLQEAYNYGGLHVWSMVQGAFWSQIIFSAITS